MGVSYAIEISIWQIEKKSDVGKFTMQLNLRHSILLPHQRLGNISWYLCRVHIPKETGRLAHGIHPQVIGKAEGRIKAREEEGP